MLHVLLEEEILYSLVPLKRVLVTAAITPVKVEDKGQQ